MIVNRSTPLRHCGYCDQKLERKTYGSVLEDLAVFCRRKYCDRICMSAGMAKRVVTRGGYLRRIAHLRGSACEVCSGVERLTINHKNRDWKDNRPENLETLCISCHMRKHWAEPGRLYSHRKVAPCIICGAVEKRMHKGMCGKHWQRFKKYGDPHLTKVRGGAVVIRVSD